MSFVVAEVIDWATVNLDNPSPLPPGPDGARAERHALAMKQMMGSVARWRDNFSVSGAIIGDPGLEGTGINIDGTVFNSSLKVSDIDGANIAQFIMHRHSTTRTAQIVASRSNSDDNSHALVTDGQPLFQIVATGYDGVAYQQAAYMAMVVDGNAGANDMPGRIEFWTTPNGTKIPINALTLRQDQAAEFANYAEAGSQDAASGATGFQMPYSGDNKVNIWGSKRSSIATVMAYGVRPDEVTIGYESSMGNSALERGALEVRGLLEFWTAPSSTTAIGTDITMTSQFLVDNVGNMQLRGGGVLSYDTLTGNSQHDVNLFSTTAGTAAQSGAFYNRLRIWGGASQTRTLELYQVPSGNATIYSSFSGNTLDFLNFTQVAFAQPIVVTGDVQATGGTFLPTGSTAAADPAAIGFSSANGLMLTGQGATYDVAALNDLAQVAWGVLTGTTDTTFLGDVIQGGFRISDTDDGIYFEDDKHSITWNDGYGNFNLRVGHSAGLAGGGEVSTEDGYATHIEWAQSTGEIQFNVSSASLLVGNTPTWWKQISILPASVSLRYQGNESLVTTSTGIDVGRTGLTSPALRIVGSATGNPNIQFMQTTTQRAVIQYLDSGDILLIDGDGEIQIAPNNTTAATFNTSGNLILEGNIEVKGQAYSPTQTLTQAATIAWNLDLGNSAATTMTGNRTLGAPTNMRAGSTYTLVVTQDATGTRTLAYNAVFDWPGGTAPVIATGNGAVSILTFITDGTTMYGVAQLDFS